MGKEYKPQDLTCNSMMSIWQHGNKTTEDRLQTEMDTKNRSVLCELLYLSNPLLLSAHEEIVYSAK